MDQLHPSSETTSAPVALTLGSTLTLNNGVQVPRLGLGVYQAPSGLQTQRAVAWALEAGYRHIDTARVYGNERDVGAAIRASGLRREEVFVTSKLWNADQGYESGKHACRESLRRLGMDYLDLYLVHWPVQGRRLDAWRALVELQEEGLCRAIGVSNYMVRHLEELLAESDVVPQANQIELSPFLPQQEVRAFCAKHRIAVEAYSPLTRGKRLRDPELDEVAHRHGKSPAQVLIRWALEQDLIVIPKSVHRERIFENAGVFDFALSEEDRRHLDSLDQDLHTSWDPSDVP